jgi:hypothetical protein
MPPTKRVELFLPLEVLFHEDEIVARVARYGKDARAVRDLLVQMWLYCKRRTSDGHVPLEEVGKFVYPDSPKIGLRDADRLVEIGMAKKTDTGYFLPGYLKRNKSRAEVQERKDALAEEGSEAGRLGNHDRWHVQRGIVNPDCEFCSSGNHRVDPMELDRVPDEDGSGSDRTEDRGQRTEDRKDSPRKRGPILPRSTDDPLFIEFWGIYPKRVGKADAFKKFVAALKSGTDPQAILNGTKRYSAKIAADRTEERFIANPATWLNQGRWDDEPATVSDQQSQVNHGW